MISYIICTLNRPEQVTGCIETLLRQVGDFELVVVDQSQDVVKYPDDSRLKVVHCTERGLSLARNIGFLHSCGNIIAYVDDDAVPADDHAEVLQSIFSIPEIDAVTGRILVSESSLPYAKSQKKRSKPLSPKDWASMLGGNIAYRRSTIENVGLFDESLGAGRSWASGEETDYFFRMHYKNKLVFYCSELIVFHPLEAEGHSMGSLRKKHYSYGLGQGALFAKHIRKYNNKLLLLTFGWSIIKPIARLFQHLLIFNLPKIKLYFAILQGRIEGFIEYMLSKDSARGA